MQQPGAEPQRLAERRPLEQSRPNSRDARHRLRSPLLPCRLASRSPRNLPRNRGRWYASAGASGIGEKRVQSIDVRLIAAGLLQCGDLARAAAALGPVHGDGVATALSTSLAMRLGIAADVEVSSLRSHAPKVGACLAHTVLHIDLAGAIARPRGRQSRQSTLRQEFLDFVAIEEIRRLALVAEEQPGPAPGAVTARSCRNARNGAMPVPGRP